MGSQDSTLELISELDSVEISRFAVVGSYTRFGEEVRQQLKDARSRIVAGFVSTGRRENHLVWAAPGSGKTYFVEQIAASDRVEYLELNLAKMNEAEFRKGLRRARSAARPVLCLIDEVDAKPDAPWPYELLLPALDANLDGDGGLVFVLAGSSGSTLEEFKQRIAARPKGADLLSRMPRSNDCVIAPLDAGDQMLVAISQMLNAAASSGRSVSAVERLALYYVASLPQLANARQLREFAVRAVARGATSDDRVKYDDLFDSGDPENKRFWIDVMPSAAALVNAYVSVDAASPSRTNASSAGEYSNPPEAARLIVGREGERARQGQMEQAMHASSGLAPLAGREGETTLLDSFIGQIGSGPRALGLVGEAGVGKSILWEHAVQVARGAQIQVLEARPAEREQGFAFAGLVDLLEGVGGHIEALPDAQRRALQVAVLRSEPLDEAIDPHLIGRAVLAVLRDLVAEQPLLLAIDDVQWLDRESREALAFALRRAVGQLGVLLARRLGTKGGDDPDLGLQVETVIVGPLDLGATQRLLRERLRAELSRSVVQRIHERAGGNPLYAIELARALQERGATLGVGEELSVPRDLGLLLHERLRALPSETAESLAAVSALGEPPVTEVDAETLEPAFRAGVIVIDRNRVRFTHPLLGAAAYEALPPNRLLALHQRLAETVDDPEQRARHLALGSAGPNEETAMILDRAATSAAVRGAPHAAAELAEQAVRLTPEKQARVERVSVAAAFHIRAGDDVRARELLEEALTDAKPGTPRARILRALGASYNYGVLERGLQYYKAALAEADVEPQLHAEILAEYGYLALAMRLDQSRAILHAAVSEAEALGDTPLLARSLSALSVSDFYDANGVDNELVERLLALQPQCEQLPIGDQPVTRLAPIFRYTGEIERARQLLARAIEIAERNGDSGVVEVHFLQCPIEFCMGTWQDGVELANRVFEAAVESDREDMISAAACARANLNAHLGDADATRRDVATARRLDELIGTNSGTLIAGTAEGVLELSLDQPRKALRLARESAVEWEREGVLDPGVRTEFPVHVEAAIAVGELDEAEQILDEIEEKAIRLDREWALACAARCRGLVAAARNDEQEAIACFERALAEQQRVEYRQFDHGRTLLCYGETLRRFKHRARARESIEQAIRIFDELEATLWAEKARRELARVSGRRTSTGLTETEQRVADLVVAGRSNKEIASELFVAVRTVEANLTRIYAKLGVRSRTELIAHLRSS